MLSKLQSDFLMIIRACFCNIDGIDISPDVDYREIYRLACEHSMQSVIYSRLYNKINLPDDLRDVWAEASFSAVTWQMGKQEKFLEVYSKLVDSGINAIVLKGITLREIYPDGDCRPSCDEDIFVDKKDVDRVISIFEECGMAFQSGGVDDWTYQDKASKLSIELHTKFIEDYIPLSYSFKSYANPSECVVDGVALRTLDKTESCLYIFFHIYQHFLASGVGIRQLCDLYQYINTYYGEINWNAFYDALEDNKLSRFFYALVNIGQQYLFLKKELFEVEYIDVDKLVEDVISSGVYGGSEDERSFINSYMLSAVKNRSANRFVNKLRMIFPSYTIMKKRYSFIDKKPYLLPAAWIIRFFRIIKSGDFRKSDKSVKKAEKRLLLFEEYGIIEKTK